MFLEEKEIFRLSQLDELKKEIEERHEDNASKLSKEISRLNKWIKKMERKCQQPAIEFLQVGYNRRTYSWCLGKKKVTCLLQLKIRFPQKGKVNLQ